MNRPLARAGRTPISSSVRIVDAPAAVGVGGGDPWNPGAGADCWITRIDVVSGPFDEVVGRGITATPPVEVDAATGVAAATPAAVVRRCGRRAIWASSSRTVCGRWAGSFASTFWSSWSSSSGRFALSLTAEGIGVLTVAYATSMRFAPTYGRRPVSISKVSAPMA